MEDTPRKIRGGKYDPRKISIYLPKPLLEWLNAQAERLERSVSWIIQQTLLHDREWVEHMPGLHDPPKPTTRLSEDQLEEFGQAGRGKTAREVGGAEHTALTALDSARPRLFFFDG